MHFFQYRDSQLFCEQVSVSAIADQLGTPFYLYSLATLRRHFTVFDQAFSSFPHLVCFSVKANSNLAILRVLVNLGGGFDIVSGGELYRALKAGCDPKKIVYSGVGKTSAEIDYALKSDILMFNVESTMELESIAEHARRMGKEAPVALRVNPDIDPRTHPYISTGLKENKFGIDIDRALREYEAASKISGLKIVGVDCHIGSQLTEVEPFVEALARLKGLVAGLKDRGIDINYLDLGGGLGITYQEESPPEPHQYAQALLDELGPLKLDLILRYPGYPGPVPETDSQQELRHS
jgi:diaminopimelate decarboxylase